VFDQLCIEVASLANFRNLNLIAIKKILKKAVKKTTPEGFNAQYFSARFAECSLNVSLNVP
jgi:SPX domain protein involved in polyphosphate accumulation